MKMKYVCALLLTALLFSACSIPPGETPKGWSTQGGAFVFNQDKYEGTVEHRYELKGAAQRIEGSKDLVVTIKRTSGEGTARFGIEYRNELADEGFKKISLYVTYDGETWKYQVYSVDNLYLLDTGELSSCSLEKGIKFTISISGTGDSNYALSIDDKVVFTDNTLPSTGSSGWINLYCETPDSPEQFPSRYEFKVSSPFSWP